MEAKSVWVSVQPHWTEQFLASIFNRFRTCGSVQTCSAGLASTAPWLQRTPSAPALHALLPLSTAGFLKAAVIGNKGYGFIDFDSHHNAGVALQAMQDQPVPGG